MSPHSPSRLAATILGVWLLLATVVGISGIFREAPPSVVGGTNAGLTLLTVGLIAGVPTLRKWALSVPLRTLILYHVVRFVGIIFLLLHARGVIPGEFALSAGWGDIAVAVLAIVVALTATPLLSRRDWYIVLGWNVFGLVEILAVLRTGIGLGFADPAQMFWITEFPLSLLPTLVVPLVLVTHVLIFVRLGRERFPAKQSAPA